MHYNIRCGIEFNLKDLAGVPSHVNDLPGPPASQNVHVFSIHHTTMSCKPSTPWIKLLKINNLGDESN